MESATPTKTIAAKASPFEKGKSYHIMRLYKELSLTPQIFTISSHKDTIIRGERAMHDFITSAAPIDLKFEPLSPEEIKERLKKLN